MGDNQHTQNIQIIKVIGESEKIYLLILRKKLNEHFSQPNNSSLYFYVIAIEKLCSGF